MDLSHLENRWHHNGTNGNGEESKNDKKTKQIWAENWRLGDRQKPWVNRKTPELLFDAKPWYGTEFGLRRNPRSETRKEQLTDARAYILHVFSYILYHAAPLPGLPLGLHGTTGPVPTHRDNFRLQQTLARTQRLILAKPPSLES